MARKATTPKTKNNQPEKGDNAATETGSAPQAGAGSSAPATTNTPPAAPAQTPAVQAGTAGGQAPKQIVTVISAQKHRRRAGREFGKEPVHIPAEDLTEAELAALRNDPTLAVSINPA